MERPLKKDYLKTVIYKVKITDSNAGAWYKDEIGKQYDCVLDLYTHTFSSEKEIVFKVMGRYHPVKFIKQQHGEVIGQRIASNVEMINHY